VNVYFGKIDGGQGIDVAIGQMVAEELDVPLKSVKVIMGDTALTLNQGGASGSNGVQRGGMQMRHAAAEARRVLLEAAAQKLNAPVDKLAVNDGVVTVSGDAAKKVSYAELIGGRFFNVKLEWNGKIGNELEAKGSAKPKTPDQARANVQNLKSQHVDFLKIWMTNPMFPPDVISAIVDEAKKQGIPVIAHVTDVKSLRQLADQGVTDFLHTPTDQPVTPELIAYAKSKKLTFAPTLANIESRWFYYEHPEILNQARLQDALYPRGRQMLADAARKAETLGVPDLAQRKARLRDVYPFIKAMSDAGVRIVTGTDCGAEASQITPFGHATHRELQIYAEAGMSPLAAIRAATLDAARVITRSEDPEYGSVRAGKVADLLLLDADPIADITNTIRISKVMRAGTWVP